MYFISVLYCVTIKYVCLVERNEEIQQDAYLRQKQEEKQRYMEMVRSLALFTSPLNWLSSFYHEKLSCSGIIIKCCATELLCLVAHPQLGLLNMPKMQNLSGVANTTLTVTSVNLSISFLHDAACMPGQFKWLSTKKYNRKGIYVNGV